MLPGIGHQVEAQDISGAMEIGVNGVSAELESCIAPSPAVAEEGGVPIRRRSSSKESKGSKGSNLPFWKCALIMFDFVSLVQMIPNWACKDVQSFSPMLRERQLRQRKQRQAHATNNLEIVEFRKGVRSLDVALFDVDIMRMR